MAKKQKRSAGDVMLETYTVYCQWIEAVLSKCNLTDSDRSCVYGAIANKPPAAYIIDNFIQAKFAFELEKKQKLLTQIKGSDDYEKIQSWIEEMQSIDANQKDWIWHPFNEVVQP
jgi:hypothetical protein